MKMWRGTLKSLFSTCRLNKSIGRQYDSLANLEYCIQKIKFLISKTIETIFEVVIIGYTKAVQALKYLSIRFNLQDRFILFSCIHEAEILNAEKNTVRDNSVPRAECGGLVQYLACWSLALIFLIK